MIDCRTLLRAAAYITAFGLGDSRPASAAEPIRVGDINTYSALPAFALPYRNGWQLALAEINDKGGVLGRSLEIVPRDDGGNAGNALTVANELAVRENVTLLMGTFFSHVGLAVSDFARQKRMLFIAAQPLSDALTRGKGNRYTFRLRPSVSMQAKMLAEEAAKMPAKRWASVAPDYEYGKSAIVAFKEIMARKRPDVEWVAEQWLTLNKIDAGPTVQALQQTRPEGIFNVTFAAALTQFVREGAARGLFRDRTVVSLLTGEPEYLDPLKTEAPIGWLVTGYPWHAIATPEHKAFLKAYLPKFNDYPRLASVVGYATMKAVAAILARAGSTDTDKMVEAAGGVGVDTP